MDMWGLEATAPPSLWMRMFPASGANLKISFDAELSLPEKIINWNPLMTVANLLAPGTNAQEALHILEARQELPGEDKDDELRDQGNEGLNHSLPPVRMLDSAKKPGGEA